MSATDIRASRHFQTWVWVLIYVGMVALGLGVSMRRRSESIGWFLVVTGAVLIALGVALIWWRSRMKGSGS